MKRLGLPLILGLIVVFTFLIRSVYLWRDFVFVYDQGRDAIEVQKILNGDLTLIGPTTGLFGVFLGPFTYYLLVPPYFLGGGNPIVPAYMYVLITSLAVVPMFYIGRKIAGNWAGFLSIFIYAFSFMQWQFSRWLANPTPLPFFALIMFLGVLRALETKKPKWFLFVGLLLGICMQLEAANAFFLIPVLLLILVIEYAIQYGGKKAGSSKLANTLRSLAADKNLILFSALGFIFTLLPQLLFEIIHRFTSTRALFASFEKMSGPSLADNLPKRADLLIELYSRGIFWRAPWGRIGLAILSVGSILLAFASRAKLFKVQAFRVLVIWFFVPLFFHLIYTGNYGNFWDYYIIGQYPALYILIGSILAHAWKQRGLHKWFGILVTIFLVLGVLKPNAEEWLRLPIPFEGRISLSLQLDAIDWIEQRAGGQPFGMWAYTPSAQDDVYRYLFSYKARYNGVLPVEHPENTKLMYLIVEDDPGNPARREQWIKEMSSIGVIKTQARFGIIMVFEVERS